MAEQHAEHTHGHHVVSNKVLNRTFFQLFLAMVLTIAAARIPFEGAQMFPGFKDQIHQFQAAWAITNFIALGIAVFKAVQVIRYFMGVQYASQLSKLYCVGGFVGFTLLFILFFDYVGRPWEPVRGWEKVPSTSFPREFTNDGGVPYPKYPGNEHGGSHSGAEAGAASESGGHGSESAAPATSGH